MDRDLYADLGVGASATAAEIRAAWKEARKRHPDQGYPSEPYIRAKIAYDWLSDPDRRAKYDAARPGQKRGRQARDARAAFNEAWDVYEATLGDVLPHVQALRGALRGNDWLAFAQESLGLVARLRGKAPKPAPQAPAASLSERLRDLQAAHEAGLLSADEYRAKRAALIESL